MFSISNKGISSQIEALNLRNQVQHLQISLYMIPRKINGSQLHRTLPQMLKILKFRQVIISQIQILQIQQLIKALHAKNIIITQVDDPKLLKLLHIFHIFYHVILQEQVLQGCETLQVLHSRYDVVLEVNCL